MFNIKESNIITLLDNISHKLLLININIDKKNYDYNGMLDENLDKLQDVLDEVCEKLGKWE